MRRKFALTLAEILISLAIIGIVACLVLPPLKTKYDEHVKKVATQKVFDELNTALKLIQIENNGKPIECAYYTNQINRGECDWVWSGSDSQDDSGGWKFVCQEGGLSPVLATWRHCKSFYEKLFENLKVVKRCENGIENDCIPLYEGNESNYDRTTPKDEQTIQGRKQTVMGCPGFSDATLKKTKAVILDNGMIVFSYGGQFDSPIIAVDLNGKKGPNRFREDVVTFRTFLDNNYDNWRWAPGARACDRNPDGKSTEEILGFQELYN